MKRLFFLFTAILLFTFLGSCSLNNDVDPNFSFQAFEVVHVNLPDSFRLNETYEIEVSYLKTENCSSFQTFEVLKTERTTREVVVFGTVRTDLECTENIVEETETFNFVVLYEEPYVFRFWQVEDSNGEAQFLEIQVPVN